MSDTNDFKEARLDKLQEVSVETLATAFHNFQTGRISEAEHLYRQILQHHPDQPEALHWLGVIAYQSGRVEQGLGFVRASLLIAIRFDPFYVY
jgi:uncharacterized protein HemY